MFFVITHSITKTSKILVDLIQILTWFWHVLQMALGFLQSKIDDFSRKSTISSNFPGLWHRIFRKIHGFWSVVWVSLRFLRVFQILITFWSIAYCALEFRWFFVDDFSIFERFSTILVDLIQILTWFLRVLQVSLEFLLSKIDDFSRKSTISSNFPGLQYRIFRKIHDFWSVAWGSLRFLCVFQILITFWSIA